jgi:hypothetical protein
VFFTSCFGRSGRSGGVLGRGRSPNPFGYVQTCRIDWTLQNSISMMEAIAKIEELTGRKFACRYVDEARKGDHICYISNLAKFKSHYPNWKIARGIDAIL